MPCNLRVKRKRHSKETFHQRGGGKRMNHEPDARTRCFGNWKWRTVALLCIHLDGHRQLAVGLEQTG